VWKSHIGRGDVWSLNLVARCCEYWPEYDTMELVVRERPPLNGDTHAPANEDPCLLMLLWMQVAWLHLAAASS
jgi:hypothetical protein